MVRFALRWIGCWCVLIGACGGSSLSAAETSAPAISSATPWQVYQVFHTACAECHGGHLTKPKGKFGYILDLRRVVDEGYVTPGDPANSDLFNVLVTTDEEEKMPPPDSDGPKLSPEEIELVRTWIAAGAATTDAPPSSPAVDTPTPPAEPPTRPLGQTLGRLHPLVVHFPIALLLFATMSEIGSRVLRGQQAWLQGATRGSLWLATAGGILAATFGWLNAAHEGYASGEVDIHRWLGIATAVLSVAALVVSELAERARARDVNRGSRALLLVVLLVSTALVTLAGHTGGVLAYGKDYLGW